MSKPRCLRCEGVDWKRIENAPFPEPKGRPKFLCSCGAEWTSGFNGGIWMEYLKKKKK